MAANNNEHEFEFKEFTDILPCAIYIIENSIIIYCNDTATKLFGYEKKEDIVGLVPSDLSPEYQYDGRLSSIKGQEYINLIHKKKSIELKWSHKKKDGNIFLSKINIYNKNGLLYVFIEDISESGMLVNKLAEREYLYHMLFESHNSIMLMINADTGKIKNANKAALDFYGYSKERLLNMDINEINILSDEELKDKMDSALRDNGGFFRFSHKLSDNTIREVDVYSFPVETENEKLLFSIIYDAEDKEKQKLMFDRLLFASPYAVAILDKEQKIVDINNNFTKMFQYNLTESRGKHISSLVSPESNKEQVDKNVDKVYRGHGVKLEGERRRKDGSLLYVDIMGYPVIHHQTVVGVYIIYIDISDKKNNEKKLHLFKKILEKNTEGVIIADREGRIEWINNAFTSITGYDAEDLLASKTDILKANIFDDDFHDTWNYVMDYEAWKGEIWCANKNGDIYSAWLSISSIKNDHEEITHYVGIMKDLSEKNRIDKRMIELQQKDSLTGLYNRHHFLEAMERHIITCEKFNHKFSVIAIDIDGFKDINDSLGHSVGDSLLIAVSERMASSCTQCMISRVDGDEFALLSTLVDKNELLYFAEMMLYQLEIPYIVSNTEIYLKFSVGICIFPDDGKNSENLMRFANAAMNYSKNESNSRICFYSNNISKETEEKFYLANYLFGALTNNELTVYFQPIFEINEVKIVGAEALLRWNSPVLGNIPPDKFISIAEKTGQIIVIGEWVIKEVCRQMHSWKNKGYKLLPISINLSVKQLEQPNFSKAAIDIINSENINPGLIEFEITESVSLGDIAQIVNNIKELKRNGIKISMDDFGTGFSSLGQLDIFELDKLKIDKIFINDLVSGLRRQNLVKSIIAMAKSLNLVTVAEGIETCEQLYRLKGLGCQLGQGFIFSKPLTAEDAENLLYQEKEFNFTACN